MIRVVVSVGLATAVLAASLPAVDDARTERTGARLDVAVERVERAARALRRHEDATGPGLPGARRSLTLDLPERSWTAAGVDLLAVGGRPRDRDGERPVGPRPTGATGDGAVEHGTVVVTRVQGGPTRVEHIPVRIDGRVVIREGGTHRLRLTLVDGDGPAVRIERVGPGRPRERDHPPTED